MKRKLLLILLLPIFAAFLSVISFSANEPYISENGYLRMQVIEYNPEDFERAWVYSVAVSENEMLAVGFDNNIVLITDKEFKVKTAINLEYVLYPKENLVVGLIWDENENLQINEPGLDTVLLVDVNGNILADYHTEDFEGSQGVSKVNGTIYGKKASNIFMLVAPDNARDEVFTVNANGTETILFKSEKNLPYFILVALAFFIGGHIFMGVGIYSVYVKQNGKKSILNRKRKNKKNYKYYTDKGVNVYRFRYGARPFVLSVLSIPFVIVVFVIIKVVFDFASPLVYCVPSVAAIIALVKAVLYFERYKFDCNIIYTKKFLKAKSISIPDNAIFLVTTALETNNQFMDNSLIVHIVKGDIQDVVNILHKPPKPFDYFMLFKKMLKLNVFDDYSIKGKYQDKWIYSFKYDAEITPIIFEKQQKTVIVPESLLYKLDVDNINYDLFVDN